MLVSSIERYRGMKGNKRTSSKTKKITTYKHKCSSYI